MPPVVRPMQGTLLKRGTTTIAQRVTLEAPEFSRASVGTGDLDTVAWLSFRPSLLADPGELSGTLYYDPQDAGHQALFTSFTSGVVEPWTLQFPEGSKYDINGFVTKLKPGDGIKQGDDGNLMASFSIKVSGAPVFTPFVGP